MRKKAHETALPKRRFPEFRDAEAWEIKTLGSVAKLIKEKAGSKRYKLMSITSGAGLVSQMEKFGREIAGASYKNYYVIRKGDFAYNKSSTKLDPEGQIALLENEEAGAVPNSIFTCFRVNEQIVSPYFLKYPFADNIHGNWLRDLIAVGARVNGALSIDSKHLLALPLALPTLPEQQKIAAALSSLDALLTAQSAKLQALQAHKRGLMQDLFPAAGETVPKRRFPEFRGVGEWEKLPIGGKVDLLSGFPFKSSEIAEDPSGISLMRGINVTSGFVRHSQDIDRFFLGNSQKLEKFKLRTDDLVIGMDGSKVGKNSALITESDSGSLLIQRVARLRPKPRVSIQFIYQHINSSIFHAYVDRVNTSGGIPHISSSQINNFEIYFPSFEEQQKIADCLSALDNLITAQSQKLAALKLHKKGLMQALFPAASEPNA